MSCGGLIASKLAARYPECVSALYLDAPVMMVDGDSDNVVPYCENGAIFEKYYRENGGNITAIGKKGC